jgi:hypothetical protein
MTRDEARVLLALQAQASTPPALTDAELNAALTASRLPDDDGHGPSHPDFVEENWDINYATAECFELKAMKMMSAPVLTEFTAEGANFKKTQPDFQAVADWWRDRSTVGDASSPMMVELDNKLPWRLRPRSSLECTDG